MNAGSNKEADERETPTRCLTGWAFMEEYTRRHDASFVKDISEDIDTMLVFAGLFSAAVTTLVALSYLLLQQDSILPVVQRLDRISTQLEKMSFSSSAPGYINSTLPAIPLQSFAFVPSGSARWVNVLWFLSLVLSLSAALFGILAKQWLREYMQWNAALGTPRENLLVRQIRFEAWNDWNAPATISAIPALLELALVMFLLGLLVFLWTLDPIVAIVITVAVTIVILITIALTIAPVFWKRCPYKSPTAWAVVILCNFVSQNASRLRKFMFQLKGAPESVSPTGSPPSTPSPSPSILHRIIRLPTHIKTQFLLACSPSSPVPSNLEPDRSQELESNPDSDSASSLPARGNSQRNWRERDIEGSRAMIPQINGASRWESLSDPRSITWPSELLSEAAVEQQPGLLAEICDECVLVRALSWASRASQDPGIKQHIALCTETLQSRTPRDPVTLSARMLSLWNLLLQCRTTSLQSLSTPEEAVSLSQFVSAARTTLWNTYGVIQGERCTVLEDEPPEVPELWKEDANFGRGWGSKDREIVLLCVLHTIEVLARELPDWESVEASASLHRRLVELLYLSHAITPNPLRNPIFAEFIPRLVDAYNICYRYEEVSTPDGGGVVGSELRDKDSAFPGRRSSLLQFIWQFVPIEIHNEGPEWTLSITDKEEEASLESLRTLGHCTDRERDHLAVMIVNRSLLAAKEDRFFDPLRDQSNGGPDITYSLEMLLSFLEGAQFKADGGSYANRVWDNFLFNVAYSCEWYKPEVFSLLHGIMTQGQMTNKKMLGAMLRVRSEVYSSRETVVATPRLNGKWRARWPRSQVSKVFKTMAEQKNSQEILEFQLDSSSRGYGYLQWHRIIWHIDEWFNSLRYDDLDDPSLDVEGVLEKITSIATAAQQESLDNYGCIDDLPWYDSLTARDHVVTKILVRRHDIQRTFVRLLGVLSTSVQGGRISGSAEDGIPRLHHIHIMFPPSYERCVPYFHLLYSGFATTVPMYYSAQDLPFLKREEASDPEMTHTNVWFVNEWLQSHSLAEWLNGTSRARIIGGVIHWMMDTVRLSADEGVPNCGYGDDLPWISTFVADNYKVARLLDNFRPDQDFPPGYWFDIWRTLWDNFLLSKRKGLLTGPGVCQIPLLWHMTHNNRYLNDDEDFDEFTRTADLVDEAAQMTLLPLRTPNEPEEDANSGEEEEGSEWREWASRRRAST